MNHRQRVAKGTYRSLPVRGGSLFIGVSRGIGEEIPPLGDVLLSLLSPDLNLLLLPATPQIVLFEGLVLEFWTKRVLDAFRLDKVTHLRSRRLLAARSAMMFY